MGRKTDGSHTVSAMLKARYGEHLAVAGVREGP